jgi:glutathione S-transferase
MVTLRYFQCRGRAQPIRHALHSAGVDFDDIQVSLGEWPSHREDPSFAGAYLGLPTLTWDDVTVAETLPIASYVAKRLGEYSGLSDAEIARREAICSNAYIELCIRVGELVWSSAIHDTAPAKVLGVFVPRMLSKLEGIERQLVGSDWLCGNAPGVADWFATEGYDAMRDLVGPARYAALGRRLPNLDAHWSRLAERRGALERPDAFTSRPDEAAALAEIRSAEVAL